MAIRAEGGGRSSGEQQAASQWMSGTETGGTTTTTKNRVYMGMAEGPGFASPFAPEGATGQQAAAPQYLSKQDAYNFFNTFSGKMLQDFIAKGQVAGQLADDAGLIEAKGFWKKLVDSSMGFTAVGRNVSPMDVLASYLGQGPMGVKGAGGGGQPLWQTQYRGGRKFLVNSQTGEVQYKGPRFETTYNKALDITDPSTAKAVATSVFKQLLHRDPGKGELGAFSAALRAAEEQSPVTTSITTEYDMSTGEAIGQSSRSEGGLSAEGKAYLLEQKAKSSKEYGAVQAATYYGPALEDAIFNNPYGGL